MLDVTLVVIGGATETDEFQLELPTVFGRARESCIPLPHPLVSRRHCELFERDGRLFVRDLGSTNGTFVGSERVTESELAHGQLLTIGTVTFRACFTGYPEPHVKDDNEPIAQIGPPDMTADSEAETSTLTRTDPGHILGGTRPHKLQRKAR